jgi:hypothetical protein
MYKCEHFKCSKLFTLVCVMINYTYFLQCDSNDHNSEKEVKIRPSNLTSSIGKLRLIGIYLL